MNRILLVEDDPILGRGVSVNLELEGYVVTWKRDFHSALSLISESDLKLLILDIGLPDGNGLDLCRRLRKQERSIPVLILTARGDEDSVVEGLAAGANDYIRKPFGNRELLARIKNAMREPISDVPVIRYGDLAILPTQRRAKFRDSELNLNRREFDLLVFLTRHAEGVVTRESLMDAVAGEEGAMYDRTIDSHVSHLRAKLRRVGIDSIQVSSIYGVGYRLEKC